MWEWETDGENTPRKVSCQQPLTTRLFSITLSSVKRKAKGTTKVVGFKLERAISDRISEIAAREDRSRSWVIRQLLLRALAANEKTA